MTPKKPTFGQTVPTMPRPFQFCVTRSHAYIHTRHTHTHTIIVDTHLILRKRIPSVVSELLWYTQARARGTHASMVGRHPILLRSTIGLVGTSMNGHTPLAIACTKPQIWSATKDRFCPIIGIHQGPASRCSQSVLRRSASAGSASHPEHPPRVSPHLLQGPAENQR